MNTIPVIDIFAGPGGLAEGFSNSGLDLGKNHFENVFSIEKDEFAHRTLQLRAFYRSAKVKGGDALKDYYDYVTGRGVSREELFERHSELSDKVRIEAICAELGDRTSDEKISKRILKLNSTYKDSQKVLVGGPPCQAYSLVGRARMNGDPNYNKNADIRHKLYREYLSILKQWKPDVFVMENVKGLLSAKLGNQMVFNLILKDLRDAGYKVYSMAIEGDENDLNPKDYVLKAEEYGIPQRRHRVILLGIQKRHKAIKPPTLKKTPNEMTVKAAISDMPKLRSGISKEEDSNAKYDRLIKNFRDKYFVNLKLHKNLNRSSEKTKLQAPQKMHKAFYKWVEDVKLNIVLNHETRTHMRADLERYFYLATQTQLTGQSPKLDQFPEALLPQHKNASSGKFADRFRVQAAMKPATTVTSHISKDGHYYIHYDPAQCRSLTVREAARLQSFPDNYFFEGPRTQQFHQVGNAVPPLLAYKIAELVKQVLNQISQT